MKVEKVYDQLQKIRREVSVLESDREFVEIEYDRHDQEAQYLADMSREMLESLEKFTDLMKWVKAPVGHEGRLVKNERDRYEVGESGWELSSGVGLEVLDESRGRWVKGALEHNGKDYYITELGRETPISGLHVRTRDVKWW